MIKFEFDPAKSESNKIKHGISFEEARRLWLDPDRIEFCAKNVEGEERRALLARLGLDQVEVFIAIFT